MKKKIISPLPVVFICVVLIIAILNMNSFTTLYKSQIIEAKPANKQAVLSTLESSYADSFMGKTNYIDINGLFARLVDKKELNNVIKLDNGYLTVITTELSDNTINSRITNILEFQEYLKLHSIPFSYIMLPTKLSPNENNQLPAGYVSYINQNMDNFHNALEYNNINSINIRDFFTNLDKDYYDYFFKTDHHWNIDGAFLAHTHVVKFIDETLDTSVSNEEYFNLENFKSQTYEHFFIGTRASRTGVLYSGVDDFSLITPNFETDIQVEMPSRGWDRRGSFEYACIDETKLSSPKNTPYLSQNPYYSYLAGQTNYTKITNHSLDNELDIFLLIDSFSRPLACFLSLHFSRVHVVDIRVSSPEEMLTKLHEVEPNLVIQILNGTPSSEFSSYLTTEAKQELKNAQK